MQSDDTLGSRYGRCAAYSTTGVRPLCGVLDQRGCGPTVANQGIPAETGGEVPWLGENPLAR